MLIEFFGENFGCFRDEFRLSFVATDIDPDSDRGIVEVEVRDDPEPLRLLRAAGIYGANASGKSTLLKAAQSFQFLIEIAGRFRSDETIPVYEPFETDKRANRPVRLGLKAIVDGIVYDYETSFDNRRVLQESLYQYQLQERIELFSRREQDVVGEWTHDERFKLIGGEFRANALLLSLADSLTPKLAGGLLPAFSRLLRFFDGSASAISSQVGQMPAIMAANDVGFRNWLLAQLKAADVGVSTVSVTRSRHATPDLKGLHVELIGGGPAPEQVLELRHQLALGHSGPSGDFAVPYGNESYGTRKIVELAPLLYSLLSGKRESAAFVDEIGASLHPNLLTALIRHVNCEASSEELAGQLIFATHETSLIDDEARKAVLRRDQVYFTSKDSSGVARLYSLADFKERQNVNLRKRYLEGRYGAIPALGIFPG